VVSARLVGCRKILPLSLCQLVNHVYLALVRPGYHSLYIQLDSPLLEPQSSLTFATDSLLPEPRRKSYHSSGFANPTDQPRLMRCRHSLRYWRHLVLLIWTVPLSITTSRKTGRLSQSSFHRSRSRSAFAGNTSL